MSEVVTMFEELKEMLKRHEGFCARAYQCPSGRWTIGYGRNIEDLGITEDEAKYLLTNDIVRVNKEAYEKFPWFAELTLKRRIAILSMIFQLGIVRFSQFRATIAYLVKGEFDKAADEALDSLWARQTPSRAREVTDMLR